MGALEKNVSVSGTPSLPLQSYYGIFLMIKSQDVQNVPPTGSCTLQLKRQNHFQTTAVRIKGERRGTERGGQGEINELQMYSGVPVIGGAFWAGQGRAGPDRSRGI